MKSIKIKKVSDTAVLPTYGTKESAGMDLYADIIHSGFGEGFVVIKPHQTVKISTGISVQPPGGYFSLVFARSGTATKKGLAPANKVGVIDNDYRGVIYVALHNHTDEEQIVAHKDRIAQLVFMPYEQFNIIETDVLDETERGSGGFGHTGE